jgi:hypothetical protein
LSLFHCHAYHESRFSRNACSLLKAARALKFKSAIERQRSENENHHNIAPRGFWPRVDFKRRRYDGPKEGFRPYKFSSYPTSQ